MQRCWKKVRVTDTKAPDGVHLGFSMRFLSSVLIALFVATSASLAAQEAPVDPGARVRVKAPPRQPAWVEGTVVRWESESLILQPEQQAGLRGAPLTLARDQISALDVHAGRRGHARRGAVIGFGVGVGWTVAIMNTESICNPVQTCSAGDWAKMMAAQGGLWAGLGALIGSLIKTDRWEAASLERIHVSLTPVRNGQLAILVSVKVP